MKLFFEIMHIAVGNRTELTWTPSSLEWYEVYEVIVNHALIGVCMSAVSTIHRIALDDEDEEWNRQHRTQNLSDDLYIQWTSMTRQIYDRNVVVNRQCAELQNMLIADGLRSSILKGQALALLYNLPKTPSHPHPLELTPYRQSGDIDIWIEGGQKRVYDWLMSKGFPTKSPGAHDYKTAIFPDTLVEAHFSVGKIYNWFANCSYQKWQKKHAEEQFLHHVTLTTGEDITTPTLEFYSRFLLAHIYRHFFCEGLGLRQVMDYYIVLRHLQAENGEDVLRSNHASFLTRFHNALLYVIHEVFGDTAGLSYKETPEGRYLLKDILSAGSFGNADFARVWTDEPNRFKRHMKFLKIQSRYLRHFPLDTLWSTLYTAM